MNEFTRDELPNIYTCDKCGSQVELNPDAVIYEPLWSRLLQVIKRWLKR